MSRCQCLSMGTIDTGSNQKPLLEVVRAYWNELQDAPSGRRFRCFYDLRQNTRQRHVARVVSIASGISLVLIGLGIGWLPGPGGFVAILGLALLAQEFRPLAALLDHIERGLVGMWRGFRDLSYPTQGGVVALGAFLSLALFYAAYATLFA